MMVSLETQHTTLHMHTHKSIVGKVQTMEEGLLAWLTVLISSIQHISSVTNYIIPH